MTSSPFTLRTDADLLATFDLKEQSSVVLPKRSPYPILVEHYYAWTDSSGAHTYLVFKRSDWEIPMGIVFQRNSSGHSSSPAGMCDWCHTSGPSDEIGLLSVRLAPHKTGGTWLCLDLSCLQRIEEQSGLAGKLSEKRVQRLMNRVGQYYQRVRIDHD